MSYFLLLGKVFKMYIMSTALSAQFAFRSGDKTLLAALEPNDLYQASLLVVKKNASVYK
jgi:hypothetical protein